MNVTGLPILLMLPIQLMCNNVETFIKILSYMVVCFFYRKFQRILKKINIKQCSTG